MNSSPSRAERVAALVSLINVRELARTDEQYDVLSEMIDDALAQMDAERQHDRPPASPAPVQHSGPAPWARIIEKVLGDIGGKTFRKPFKFSKAGEPDAVYIRTRHIMDHLVECNWLRDNWHGMPIRSDRVLKRELRQAGVLLLDDGKEAVERTVNGQRVSHMVGISLAALQANGIDATKARQIVLDPVLL